jgi:HlyD family secretion protein
LEAITALGRLEPKGGVMHIAGPSRPAVVISKLLVDEGDAVTQGQVIAVLDSLGAQEALIDRLRAELENAEAEFRRIDGLHKKGFASASERDAWHTRVEVARANLRQAQAELDYSVVRSPIDGQVLTVHTRPGERVGADGIAEVARTNQMYAIAEVYETDVTKVRVGQHAAISSTALSAPLKGTVERVGMKIGKRDVLATDPAADTDARVVEVHIRLDDSKAVAGLTNLKVEVRIELDGAQP